jgi:hypothetical protein
MLPRQGVCLLPLLILYELLAGERPFRGSTRMLLHHILLDEAPSPRRLNSRVPRDLETICLKCLEKDPGRRYQTARELADDLRRFLDGQPVKARPLTHAARTWRWCKRKPMAAAVVGLVVFLALAGPIVAINQAALRYDARRAQRDAAEKEIAARESLGLGKLNQAQALRWSMRQGQRMESLKALDDAAQIFSSLGKLDEHTLELRNQAIVCLTLVDLREEKSWVVAPNRRHVYFDSKLQRYTEDDGSGKISIRRVSDQREILRVSGELVRALSHDGQYVVVTGKNGRCQVWDVDQAKALLEAPVPLRRNAVAFSPDSCRVAIGRPNRSIHTYEIPSAIEQSRITLDFVPEQISFQPGGERLAVCGSRSMASSPGSARMTGGSLTKLFKEVVASPASGSLRQAVSFAR